MSKIQKKSKRLGNVSPINCANFKRVFSILFYLDENYSSFEGDLFWLRDNNCCSLNRKKVTESTFKRHVKKKTLGINQWWQGSARRLQEGHMRWNMFKSLYKVMTKPGQEVLSPYISKYPSTHLGWSGEQKRSYRKCQNKMASWISLREIERCR